MNYARRMALVLLVLISAEAQCLQSLEDGLIKSKQVLNMVTQAFTVPDFLKCHEESVTKDPEFIYDQAFHCEQIIDDVQIIHGVDFKIRKGILVETAMKIDIQTDSAQMARVNAERLLDEKNVEVFRNAATGNNTYKVSWFEIGPRKYHIHFFPHQANVMARPK